MAIDLAGLKNEVIAKLGGSVSSATQANAAVVNVELTQEQFNAAVALCTRWFNQKKGISKFMPLEIVDGISQYTMPGDSISVMEVFFSVPSDVAAFFTLGFFDVIPFGAQPTGGPVSSLTNYSSFAQLLEFNEQRKRIFSIEPEWWYDDQIKQLFVTVRKGSNTGQALVYYRSSAWQVQQLAAKDEDLFTRRVHAECKEIVGRIRSKYDLYPTAGGQTGLDGKTLIDEAKEEKKVLDGEIFASQGPDLPVVG